MASLKLKKPLNKVQTVAHLASETGLTRKQVSGLLSALEGLVAHHLKTPGVGSFTLNSLLKIRLVSRKAIKSRVTRNPKTGEELKIQARPARKAIRVVALKKLKGMI